MEGYQPMDRILLLLCLTITLSLKGDVIFFNYGEDTLHLKWYASMEAITVEQAAGEVPLHPWQWKRVAIPPGQWYLGGGLSDTSLLTFHGDVGKHLCLVAKGSEVLYLGHFPAEAGFTHEPVVAVVNASAFPVLFSLQEGAGRRLERGKTLIWELNASPNPVNWLIQAEGTGSPSMGELRILGRPLTLLRITSEKEKVFLERLPPAW